MKASDYVVEFLIQHKITDIFGYPGGMVTHFMDSLDKYRMQISAHLNYHEQACAMAACGWAEITGLPGVAYATSGPGATNLLTGIACAYFDSLPCIFITGQVNTYEQKENLRVRQKGFQETDIVSMAQPITKQAVMVRNASELPELLETLYRVSMEGRRGPVLVDIPMNVWREDIEKPLPLWDQPLQPAIPPVEIATGILHELQKAHRPVILAGHGITLSGSREYFRAFVEQTGIPTVTSMIAVDVLPSKSAYCYGMIGAYGNRWSNYLVNHSDCILSLGSRLDSRQTGTCRDMFAPTAKLLRVDIDRSELEHRVNDWETHYEVLLEELLPVLLEKSKQIIWKFHDWQHCCMKIYSKLKYADRLEAASLFVEKLGELCPDGVVITTDVGQNQVWVAQSLEVKENQRILFSGGHGAMGYSLPAAIGAAIATKHPIICVTGDGGLQMNIQELQTVVREHLPIKIILLNNRALGMIHHFQEMYFDSNFVQTDDSAGFTVPDFIGIAKAYGIRAMRYTNEISLKSILADADPAFIEVALPQTTRLVPKLGLNKPIHEQEPPLSEKLQNEISTILKYKSREQSSLPREEML